MVTLHVDCPLDGNSLKIMYIFPTFSSFKLRFYYTHAFYPTRSIKHSN